MVEQWARTWRVIALRGVIAVIVGVLALFWPLATLVALVLLFGAYALLDGIALVVMAFGIHRNGRWWLAIEGLIGIAVGLFTWVSPQITALALIYLIAFWAIVTGVLEIVAAIRLRRVIDHLWLTTVDGTLSVVMGIIFLFVPAAGALAWVWLLGAYALIAGCMMLALAFRLRALGVRRTHALI
jgi:uncharacterized membrane protein HdeD (DUF308 family)